MSILRVLHGLSERRRGAQVSMASRVPGEIEPWHVLGDLGEPTLEAGWSNLAGRAPVAFRKDADGVVYLRGTIRAALPMGPTPYSQSLAFTLPVGYRPPVPMTILTCNQPTANTEYSNLYRTNLLIATTGTVTVETSNYRGVDTANTLTNVFLDGRRHRLR